MPKSRIFNLANMCLTLFTKIRVSRKFLNLQYAKGKKYITPIIYYFQYFLSKVFFAAASPTLYYHIEPKFHVNFRQSEVFLNCNIHHTS